MNDKSKPGKKIIAAIAAACLLAAACAAYLITSGPAKIKVAFNSQGGSVVKTQAVKLGGKATPQDAAYRSEGPTSPG
jgi:hypothetical protein